MTPIQQLKVASFAGISFPYSECTVKLGQRKHVHVYLETPGGALQKLGRELYQIEFTVPAHEGLSAPYAAFYSTKLPALWSVFERSETADLTVPSIGTLRAFNTDATRSINVRVQSGEALKLSFLEDQEALFSANALITPSVDGIPPVLRSFLRRAPAAVPLSTLDKLTAAVNDLVTLRDQGELAARIVSAKASGVIAQCEAIYRLPRFGEAVNFSAVDALLDIQFAAVTIREDAARRARSTYLSDPTPSRMSITQLSAWLYGDTSHASELLVLNAFTDPLSVPRYTQVRRYV